MSEPISANDYRRVHDAIDKLSDRLEGGRRSVVLPNGDVDLVLLALRIAEAKAEYSDEMDIRATAIFGHLELKPEKCRIVPLGKNRGRLETPYSTVVGDIPLLKEMVRMSGFILEPPDA